MSQEHEELNIQINYKIFKKWCPIHEILNSKGLKKYNSKFTSAKHYNLFCFEKFPYVFKYVDFLIITFNNLLQAFITRGVYLNT